MIKFNRITDEILFHFLLPEINRYLAICSIKKNKNETIPNNISDLLKYNKYNETIYEFIQKFKESFTTEQINAMLCRLKGLKINEVLYKKPPSLYYLSLGYYRSLENEIVIEYYKDRRISEESVYETLIHELIHMASTREVQDGAVTGFEIPFYLGAALNEGYTEYISQKYFTKGMKYVKSESIKLFIAKGIENIVGQDKMQELFFNADLNGLINELSKYSTRENITRLLFLIDCQEKILRGTKDLYVILEEIARLNEIKLKRDLRLGLISYEEYQIEYAKKVTEYLKGNMWSEETKVIRDNNSFLLYDQGFSSGTYEIRPKEKNENKVKYYQ